MFWADCETKGCPWKVCLWASETRCYPCEEKRVGSEVMERRYNLSHVVSWNQSDDHDVNPMIRQYREIKGL